MLQVSYRTAVEGDAWNLICVHYAAVQSICGVYSADVLLAWSPPPDDARRQRIAELISQNSTVCTVAEVEARTVGFVIAIPARKMLQAVYVHPDFSGSGIGKGLLHNIEVHCRDAGITSLEVKASCNAEGFYRHCGYETTGRTIQELAEGFSMAAIQMVKNIQQAA